MEPLRVGLVGYGGAGRGIHSRLLRAAGQRVTHVVTARRAAQVADDWPGAAVLPDAEAMWARADEVDLLVVASPTGDHAAHVTAALATGRHVLVDKPLAVTTEEAAALAALADGRLTVFQNRRWDPEQLALTLLEQAGVRMGQDGAVSIKTGADVEVVVIAAGP